MGVEPLKLCHIRCVASHFAIQLVVLVLFGLSKPGFEVSLVTKFTIADTTFGVGLTREFSVELKST